MTIPPRFMAQEVKSRITADKAMVFDAMTSSEVGIASCATLQTAQRIARALNRDQQQEG